MPPQSNRRAPIGQEANALSLKTSVFTLIGISTKWLLCPSGQELNKAVVSSHLSHFAKTLLTKIS